MGKRKSDIEPTPVAFERALRFLLKEGCLKQDAKDRKMYLSLIQGKPRPDTESERASMKLMDRRDRAEDALAILEFLAEINWSQQAHLIQMVIRAAAGWGTV